ncbi:MULTISPECIES: aminotransferase class V-fold PLP-dependent enzyme [unclassified Streptomyces]|uniref:pyridoxal phosphate-dependent decarboxylase family protein n=1 Tax=unclassified Streptomyces TaxID=2593676 RepID=UPI00224DCA76|nr:MULTISPECIES: aminotransferase class V-fold PLP-dependent enzyme [unclassified Streptomyces]MCX4524420.1 aminotransferase class V-fold PLP-dependent enzyme [Streptomyces sp. NBC_01551]MCX4545058.1 aminotransferase class V-fold PLP-dependent enzyme [Streptomyces sp. NBC_01565]
MPTPPEIDCLDHLASARPECGGGAVPLAVHPKVFRDELAAAADWVASYLQGVGQRPVTRPMPPAHRQAMATGSLPQDGQDLGSLLEFVDRAIAPYPTGNGHPAFFAWINSPPSPAGVIAELLATAVNATCGMGEHALMDLERGVLRDLASLAGLAPTAGGVLTSGGSMANLLCLGAARTWFLRQQGATDGPAYDQAHARLVAYHSDQAHMSVAKAAAVIGLPPWRLRAVPTTPDRSMDIDALRTMVDADHAAGLLPFCVVSNLGSTATGAIDPIEAITRVCHRSGLWHHGDGAWGGLGALVPELAPSYRGIAGLDSLTVDPHKALSVPVGCGAALVTDPSRLRDAFTFRASYLEGDQDWPWMSDYTIELTRPGTRALTLWATLRHLGRSGVVALLQHYQDLARYLRHRVQEHPLLELCTSGPLPVVCFRLAAGPEACRQGQEDLHTAVAARVQARGHAYLATVSHDGQTVLRACVCNHLTTTDDVDTLLHEVLAAADHLQTVQ